VLQCYGRLTLPPPTNLLHSNTPQQQALGRTVFAFSRDKLLPFSSVWTIINRRTGTPIYAVWISVFWCIVINLIGLGSYAAISGVFNICAICLDWSYCIPIICKMIFGTFEPGPWYMGRASMFVNAWAVIWTAFVSTIFLFPTFMPVTANTMNYAIAFLGLIFLAAAVWWYASGKKFYIGPLTEANILEGESQEKASGESPQGYPSEKGAEIVR
jgi:amino acid transporter